MREKNRNENLVQNELISKIKFLKITSGRLLLDISSQLGSLFNLSLPTQIFPYVLKTSKTISIHKKDSN